MCIKIINRFHGCPHNGTNTSRLTYIDRSTCPTRTCADPLRTEVKWFEGACFRCRGLRAPDGDKIVGWFKVCFFVSPIHSLYSMLPTSGRSNKTLREEDAMKSELTKKQHCMFSNRCRHEHSHCEVEGLERYESEEDFILETPSNELCPDCEGSGEVSSAPSSIPRGYRGRSHVSMDEFASVKASRVSIASVRPRASRAPTGLSRMQSRLDSPPPPMAPRNSRASGPDESSSGNTSTSISRAPPSGSMSSTGPENQRHAERPRHPPPARGSDRRRSSEDWDYYSESNT